jgi:hypothetical protein
VSSAQWSTHDHDDYSNKDRFASSQVLSEDTGGNAATKSTDFEDGYNQSFDIPASRWFFIDAEGPRKSGGIDKTAHKAIVKTNQEKSQTRDSGYCVEEGVAC